LEHDPEWKMVYSDRLAVLLERSGTIQTSATSTAQ